MYTKTRGAPQTEELNIWVQCVLQVIKVHAHIVLQLLGAGRERLENDPATGLRLRKHLHVWRVSRNTVTVRRTFTVTVAFKSLEIRGHLAN